MARPKAHNHDEVMDKAMELFWKKGFHGTSIQDLVDHLGINRSTMYASFGDKNKLFLDALKHYRTQQKNFLPALPAGHSLADFLEGFLDNVIQDSLKDPDRKGCFIVNTSIDRPEDDDTCTELQDNLKEFTSAFAHLFDEAKKTGEIAADADTRQLAHFLYNTISGLRVIGRTKPDPAVLHNIKDVSLKALFSN